MAICRKMICTVAEDDVAAGYYMVTSYATGDPGTTSSTAMYRKLTWTEAVDVVLVTFDENRPGLDGAAAFPQQKLW